MPEENKPKTVIPPLNITPPLEPKVMPTAMQTHENMERIPNVDLKKRRL
ncbi:MAG: hypothetical protein LUQ31_10125 [Methanoregula sp.]|nr:hypothetical protein [Methanoregula sp.]